MVGFVYFDAGGTLLTPKPSVGGVYAKAGRPFGLEESTEALEAAFVSCWSDHVRELGTRPLALAPDEDTNREWWRALVFRVLEHVGFSGDHDGVFEACYRSFESAEAWRIYDDVLPTVSSLRAHGVPMGVLSNWDHRLPGLLDVLALSEYFDPLLVSALEGVEKPDPRFFQLACRRVSLPPEEILYVGDHPRLDLEPALALGMRAYLIDRDSRHHSPRSIETLEALIPLALKR